MSSETAIAAPRPAADEGQALRWPDFYIVGAPRCGTTYTYQVLREHPQVFMTERKELRHFCPDLDSGDAADAELFIRGREQYLALFAAAPGGTQAGDASPMYLYSKVAARLIRDVAPAARIVVQVRDPVEQIASHHAHRRRFGQEDLGLEEALAAEADRRAGRRLPPGVGVRTLLQYRDVARYGEQLQRYADHFEREQIHVLLVDDLAADPAATMRRLFRFLGIDPNVEVSAAAVNAHHRQRVPGLDSALRMRRLRPYLRRMLPRWIRRPFADAASRVRAANRIPEARAALPAKLRARLQEELAPDLELAGRLVGIDLAARWWGSQQATPGQQQGRSEQPGAPDDARQASV